MCVNVMFDKVLPDLLFFCVLEMQEDQSSVSEGVSSEGIFFSHCRHCRLKKKKFPNSHLLVL